MQSVGDGDFKYELVPSWPNLPKYWVLGMASDGAVISRDEVHIFSRGLHPPDHMGHRRQLHLLVGRRSVLGQPPRHIHRAERQRLARGPRLPCRYGVHPGGRGAEDVRREARAVTVLRGRALQHAIRPRHRAGREHLRVRRLWRAPRPQVQPGRTAPAVVGGRQGTGAGRVRPAP